jgi:hypothetical protein
MATPNWCTPSYGNEFRVKLFLQEMDDKKRRIQSANVCFHLLEGSNSEETREQVDFAQAPLIGWRFRLPSADQAATGAGAA